MKNKKGFTLVELLAVIAILAILVIIALPNVINMYTDAKKNSFVTEAQSLAKNVASKFMSENMKGNHIKVVSNKENSLDMSGEKLEYNFELDNNGKIKNMFISNGTYCVSTNKDYTQITKEDISEECSYDKTDNIAGTLMKDFYTNRLSVYSISFYSDGRVIEGSETTDVSEEKDGSVKMYVTQNTEYTSLVDLTIVANGKIAFPEDSSSLLSFYGVPGHVGPESNLKIIEFNDSIDTSNVTNMRTMFAFNNVDKYDFSSFDTSKVTNMSSMFAQYRDSTGPSEFDLSSFDTSNVTDMGNMFYKCEATIGYARTQADADKFNSSDGKPSGLTFTVK